MCSNVNLHLPQRQAIRPAAVSDGKGLDRGHRAATAGAATAMGGSSYRHAKVPHAGVYGILGIVPRTGYISQAPVC